MKPIVLVDGLARLFCENSKIKFVSIFHSNDEILQIVQKFNNEKEKLKINFVIMPREKISYKELLYIYTTSKNAASKNYNNLTYI